MTEWFLVNLSNVVSGNNIAIDKTQSSVQILNDDRIVINEDAGEQLINLVDISGTLDDSQVITVTATSSSPELIRDLQLDYFSDDSTATLKFSTEQDANGQSLLTVTTTDGAGRRFGHQFLIEVNPVNDAPDAVDDHFTTTEDTVLASGNVLAADSDIEGQSLIVSAVSGGSVGTEFSLPSEALLTLNADGTFNYDPNGQFETLAVGETALDDFTYTIIDSQGKTDTASVMITVTGVNDTPVAVDDDFTTTEDTVLASGNVLAADSDIEGQSLIVSAVSGGSVGTEFSLPSEALLTLNADGTFNYDPNGQFETLAVGETALDDFTYTIIDSQGKTDTASVTITVTGVKDAPVAVDDDFTTTEDTVLASENVLAADSDIEGQSLIVSAVSGGSVGTEFSLPSEALLTLNADGTFNYDPNGQFETLAVGETALDDFTYTIIDSQGKTDTASVTITVTGVNDAPVAVDDDFTTTEDTVLASGNVLAADSDIEGQNLIVSAVSGGSVGSEFSLPSDALLTLNADGTFNYDPNGQFETLAVGETALDDFTYTIIDSQGKTDTASVTITVTGVNDAPVAVDDDFTTTEDTVLASGNVLAADSDIEGQSLIVSAVSGGSVGSEFSLPSDALLTLNADGTFNYDPNGQFETLAVGETALDDFTYTIIDSQGKTDTASVTITVTGVNDAPVAVDDDFTTTEDTVLASGNVLAADSDIEGQSLIVSAVSGGSVGSEFSLPSDALLTLNADGTFNYDPNGQFETLAVGETALDDFTYTIIDTQGKTDTASVTITVTGVNDAPLAVDDDFTTTEDTVLASGNVLAADSDIEGQSLIVSAVSGGSVGSEFSLPSDALADTKCRWNV